MLLDVSHINEKSFWDICDTATKPFVATHSNFTDFLDKAAVTTFASVTNMNEFNNISQVQTLTTLLRKKDTVVNT